MVDYSFVVEVRGLLSNGASSVDEREPTGAERAALLEWERKEGIVFPDDYRECVLRFGGRVFGSAKRPFVRRVGVRAFYATEFAGALLVMPRPAGFDRDRYRRADDLGFRQDRDVLRVLFDGLGIS